MSTQLQYGRHLNKALPIYLDWNKRSGLRRDFPQRQVKLLFLFVRQEKFLQQHYLPFGLEFSQSFQTFGLAKGRAPFPTGERARGVYGTAGFPVRIPGQEDAAFLGVLEQVTFLYRHLTSVSGDELGA
jgi:hypothetical protein